MNQSGSRMSKNFLLSSTRMWNCGDDFIAFGVRNLISRCVGENCNYIVYNRNPDLHFQRTRHAAIDIVDASRNNQKTRIDLSDYLARTNWVFDNSWHPRNGLKSLSAVVFAGTPEWFGPMVRPLTQILHDSDLPVLYLGIGGFEGRASLKLEKLSAIDQALLQRAKLISVRDAQTRDLLAKLEPELLPCPALFSNQFAEFEKNKRGAGKKLKIALSTQPDNSIQPLSSEGVYDYTVKLFRALIEKFECEVVCHYVDELEPLAALGVPLRYSYDARDYFEIYNQYDLLVTTRVHGAGAAASLGIPAFVISHSARSDTVRGFLSEQVSPQAGEISELVDRIADYKVKDRSAALKDHKRDSLKRYESLLKPVFSAL